MRRPVIGIATAAVKELNISIRASYINAVLDHGGIPCPLPPIDDPAKIADLCDSLDGLLLSGGVDVDPVHYGETVNHPTVEINPVRDAFELALFTAFFETKKPIFGICRGVQLMNVALGGSLIQHIEGHRQTPVPRDTTTHEVLLADDSRLARICGCNRLAVNSFHHQAVKHLGQGASISAITEDGVIEGIELPETAHPFFLGVQWHPEHFYQENPPISALFSSFIRACSERMETKK